jgi:CubicO group peptidase (beta-lactamase class C family)
MLVMQLVEEGKVKLDGKINDCLPDYREDLGDKVTIHQLLTHTSGISSYHRLPDFFSEIVPRLFPRKGYQSYLSSITEIQFDAPTAQISIGIN